MSSFSPSPQTVLEFLQQCPAYKPSITSTIMTALGTTVRVKNEANRMGLGSFKGLGGIYAIAQLIRDQWKLQHGNVLLTSELFAPSVQDMTKSLCFVCASAGNHGIAVSVGAKLFGASARVYLSQNVPDDFERRLQTKGTDVRRAGLTYEESMAAAMNDAKNTGAILLSDSSWIGYEYEPSLIMEGYTVIAHELETELKRTNNWPSHVYLQAGVGGFAGAMTYMIRQTWPIQPKIYIVEPEFAACLKASNEENKKVVVTGPVSSMGRLDCKEPSIIALRILHNSQVHYITVSENHAAQASYELKKQGLLTTPSGAAGFAAMKLIEDSMGDKASAAYKPLIFVTEDSTSD